MNSTTRLLLAVLATYRLTHLLVYDEGPWQVFLRFRTAMGVYDYRYVLGNEGTPRTLRGRLFACPYCVGMYMAWATALAVLWPTPLGDAGLIALGIAGGQSVLQGLQKPD